MPTTTETFGARLKARRLRTGLTIERLGVSAGLTANTVGRLERGATNLPTLTTMQRLADALDCDVLDLVSDAFDPEYPAP